jgi:hypothetical protein
MKTVIKKLYTSLLAACCVIAGIAVLTIALWSIHDGYLQYKYCEDLPKFEDTVDLPKNNDFWGDLEIPIKQPKSPEFISNEDMDKLVLCEKQYNGDKYVIEYKDRWGDLDFATNPFQSFFLYSFLWIMLPVSVYLIGSWLKWVFKK